MSIGSIGSTITEALQQATATSSTSSASGAKKTTSSEATDSAAVSGPAQMLAKLSELQKSDPAKLKEVATSVASALTTAAGAASDPQESKMLKEIASRFQSVASTGDLSALQPPKGGPGGRPPAGGRPPGGPPPGAAAGAKKSSASSAKATDPADTNQDGKVSNEEQRAYDEKVAAAKRSLEGKSATGSQSARERYEHSGEPRTAKANAMAIVDSALAAAL
jgi:hypothetical protein